MPDAEQSLRNLLDQIAIKLNYVRHNVTLKAISSEGANYTTVLFLATISAADKENIEVFAKVANIGDFLRNKFPVGNLFKTERFFYVELLNKYKKIEDELQVSNAERFVAPKFYGCNDVLFEETIVLENLIPKGFTVYDRFKSIDWKYASESIRQLAKLHALSFAFAEDDPEGFKELEQDLKCYLMGDENDEQMIAAWNRMMDTAVNAVNEVNREKARNFVQGNMRPSDMKKYREPFRHSVIIHGDYRASNLMHKTKSDGSLEVVIIDYQTLQMGCPIMDLLYFIFNCSDEEFRREYYDKLIEHYYTQLRLELQRLHVDPDKVYPREDFEYELKEMLPFGLSIGMFTLQVVTVEAANAPKLDRDLSEFSVKTSDLFADRLNGIVNDYIRWGIL